MKVAERTDLPVVEPARTSRRGHRPVTLWTLLALLGTLSLGGFYGGLSFMSDPTGAALQAKLAWLEKTPVTDFFFPGLFLLGVYGIGSLLVMLGSTWRLSPGFLRRVDARIGFHWSWAGSMLLGAVLIVWILYEFAIFSDRIVLQPILIGVGVLMVAIPLMPSMRRQYRTDGS